MKIVVLLAALSAMPAQASDLPDKLTCSVTGHAGCTDEGICVGAGRSDPTKQLTIYVPARSVVLNYIVGEIAGSDPIDGPGVHALKWHNDMLFYDRLTVSRMDGRVIVELFSGNEETEFECHPA